MICWLYGMKRLNARLNGLPSKKSKLTCKSKKMKPIFTLLLLPVIILAYFFSARLYVNGDYLAAYSLVATWFLSVVFWIRQVSLLMQRQKA
jgi:hypothetical protein